MNNEHKTKEQQPASEKAGRLTLERNQAEEALRISEEQYRILFENNPHPMWVYDLDTFSFLAVNEATIQHYGYSRDELLSMTIKEIHPQEEIPVLLDHISKIASDDWKHRKRSGAWKHIKKDGQIIDVETTSHGITFGGRRARFVLANDVTERKRAESLMAGQKRILELIARDTPLSDVLDGLARFIERQSAGTFCSIALLDPSGKCLRRGAAPSLPESFSDAIDGLLIGPRAGSCGGAAYLGQQVISADIATDPLWADYADWIISNYGLKAAWSTPILSMKGKVLGTFSMYYKEPCAPDQKDLEFIEMSTQLAGVAIERKQSEEELRTSQERYRAVVEQASEGIFLVHTKTKRILESNAAFQTLLGYTAEEMLDLLLYDVVAHDPKNIDYNVQLNLTNKRLFLGERQYRRKDGSIVYVDASSTLIHKEGEVLCVVVRDATERKRAKEALLASEKRFRALIENSSDVLSLGDAEGKILYTGPSVTNVLGYSVEEFVGRYGFEFIHPDDLEYTKNCLSNMLQRPGSNFSTVIRGLHKDGSWRWMDCVACNLLDEPDVRGIVVNCRDITERKRAEGALAAEKERLQVTLRSIGDGVIATDMEGKIVLLNKVAEKLTGWSQEEALNRSLSEVFNIIDEKSCERRTSPVDEVLSRGEAFTADDHTTIIARDGTERIISHSGAPIRDSEGRIIGVVLAFNDITNRRRMEEELLKASKLESVGVLAGGIAHDFNNILTAIMGNISLAKMYTGSEDRLHKRLSEAEQACIRARDLTQQLLTFSRGGAPIKRTASIADLLNESASFALSGSSVRCEFDLPNDLWPVEIDEGQISQVIHNLVLNAQEAMPVGGTIKVKAENMTIEAEEQSPSTPLRTGRYVKMTIEDQGVGIPEEHLGKIFDPYFTTKQKGSGLGLATSYSIIRNHEGYLTAESQLGAGTTFYIYLPASQNQLRLHREAEGKLRAGKGRILVMDDEETIRKLAGDVLAYFGYEADFAKDGAEAIEMYVRAKDSGEPFDVVIMDLTIPGGMGGKEAIKRLREIDPDVKAIVSSGYSNDPVMAGFREYGFSGVVAKPYKISEIGEALHKLLSE